MGGGKQTTTTSSSSAPWDAAQPALKLGLEDATNLYKGGIGGAVNTLSNVVPYAKQSTDAFDSAEGLARANMNGQGLSGQYQNIINSGGYNANQSDALNGIRQTANGAFNPFDNAGFGSVLKQAQDSAGNAVNATASGAGRYGSPAHQGMLAKSVGDVTGGLMNNEWNNFNQRKSGAQMNLFNAGQQGMQNLSGAFNGMQSPIDMLTKVGGAYEDLYGRQINDRNRIFDAQNEAPWQQLARLNAVASGMGQMGGQTSGSATQPGQSPFGQLGGGLLALSGLFGG